MLEIILIVATIAGGITAIYSLYIFFTSVRLNEIINKFKSKNWQRQKELMEAINTFNYPNWKRVKYKKHYIAWDGPLDFITDKEEIEYNLQHVSAIKKKNKEFWYANRFIPGHIESIRWKEGYRNIYETDCLFWKAKIVDDNMPIMIKSFPKNKNLNELSNSVYNIIKEVNPELLKNIQKRETKYGNILEIIINSPNSNIKTPYVFSTERNDINVSFNYAYTEFFIKDLKGNVKEAIEHFELIKKGEILVKTFYKDDVPVFANFSNEKDRRTLVPPYTVKYHSFSGKLDHIIEKKVMDD